MSAQGPSEAEMRAANVNPNTGLATDYLNLFNEATMLFELALDMPEMAGELESWTRKSYVQHFEHSGFAKRDIVIAAYYAAPSQTKERFDGLCEQACDCFEGAIGTLIALDPADERGRFKAKAELGELKHLVSLMDAEIHGRGDAIAASESGADSNAIDQAAIDALF